MKKIVLHLFIIGSLNAAAQKAIFEDQLLLDSIEICADYIYSGYFNEAGRSLQYIIEKTPGHPIGPFLQGLAIYWKDFPLTPQHESSDAFIHKMLESIELNYNLLEKKETEVEGTLLALTSRAMLMMYFADNGIYSRAIEHVYPAYRMVMRSFKYNKENPEFYYYSGLYNYYREEYPKAHPIYKPVVYFLKRGNTVKGIEQLKYTAENGILMNTESCHFLVFIYLFYENNPNEALQYARKLYEMHENNLIFLARYTELLILNEQYQEAEERLEQLFNGAADNKYLLTQAFIYKGMIEEKHYKNYNIAVYNFQKGLGYAGEFKSFADNYKPYAYLGLSRIYQLRNKKDLAKKYYQQAETYASYPFYFN